MSVTSGGVLRTDDLTELSQLVDDIGERSFADRAGA